MKGYDPFQEEIINAKEQYIKKSSSPEPLVQFQPNLTQGTLKLIGLVIPFLKVNSK